MLRFRKTRCEYVDVYPKVVPSGKRCAITINPVIDPGLFAGRQLTLEILPLQQREYPLDDTLRGHAQYAVAADADGRLRFEHVFDGEQEHFLRVHTEDRALCEVSVYSVEQDLVGLIPLYGDLHVHTNHSDGRESPGFVAAEYRRTGYDFLAITDHHTMSGSLTAAEVYRDAPIDLTILRGEEVHLPDCPLHVIHIGGRWSVNARVQSQMDRMDQRDPTLRARFPAAWQKDAGSGFPGTLSDEEFHSAVWQYAEEVMPHGTDLPRFTLAGFAWICREIRRAGGLPIFVHPYWIQDLYHADERLAEYILTHGIADAYEILGGERYLEQNGFQTAQYYDLARRGCTLPPIVGSSDSHAMYDNDKAYVASTIAFARANRAPELLEAIRAGRSVAVDWINTDPRLVGDYRLVKYAQFLLANYFPIHHGLCVEEGRAMKEYMAGDRAGGERMLKAAQGRVARSWKQYFAFDLEEGD